MSRRGYRLIVDMSLGAGAGLVGGNVCLAFSGLPAGMLVMFIGGAVVASSVLLAQRLWWPLTSGARERKGGPSLVELGRPLLGEAGATSGHLGGGVRRPGRLMPPQTRMVTTEIYLLRGLPLELQRVARARAVSEGTTLRQVLLQGLGEYAAGTWTPQPDALPPVARDPGIPATGR